MIPDKIYTDNRSVYSELPIFSQADANVEYVRKNALLEWLYGKVYEHNEDHFDDGFNTAMGQVIDKLNSL